MNQAERELLNEVATFIDKFVALKERVTAREAQGERLATLTERLTALEQRVATHAEAVADILDDTPAEAGGGSHEEAVRNAASAGGVQEECSQALWERAHVVRGGGLEQAQRMADDLLPRCPYCPTAAPSESAPAAQECLHHPLSILTAEEPESMEAVPLAEWAWCRTCNRPIRIASTPAEAGSPPLPDTLGP